MNLLPYHLYTLLWATLLLSPLVSPAQNDKQVWVQQFGPAYSSSQYPHVAADVTGNIVVSGGVGPGYGTIKYSPTGVPLWTNYYDGGYGDEPTAVAVASNGNVFVTGRSYPGDWEDVSPQYLTVAYTGEGIPLWTNRYTRAASPVAIAADANGDVIMTGGEEFIFGDGGWVTIKYSAAGVPVWTNVHHGQVLVYGYVQALAVDHNNDVTVVGSSSRYVPPSEQEFQDFTVLKYSSAGTALWTNQYSRGGDAYAKAVAITTNGDIYATGGASATHDYANEDQEIVTIKYSSSGLALWTNLYHAPGKLWSAPVTLALDNSGDVLMTGYSFENNDQGDFVTIKYSSSGAAMWTNTYAGPTNRLDLPFALGADASANVYVTGTSSYYPNADSVTLAYSSAGAPLWTNFYHGNIYYGATDLAVLGVGKLVVASYSAGDYVTIKYDLDFASDTSMPELSVSHPGSGNRLVLSWSKNAVGFKLQSTTHLTSPVTWADIDDEPALMEGRWTLTNSFSGVNKYFRLRKP